VIGLQVEPTAIQSLVFAVPLATGDLLPLVAIALPWAHRQSPHDPGIIYPPECVEEGWKNLSLGYGCCSIAVG
jgi:hypothetical protein